MTEDGKTTGQHQGMEQADQKEPDAGSGGRGDGSEQTQVQEEESPSPGQQSSGDDESQQKQSPARSWLDDVSIEEEASDDDPTGGENESDGSDFDDADMDPDVAKVFRSMQDQIDSLSSQLEQSQRHTQGERFEELMDRAAGKYEHLIGVSGTRLNTDQRRNRKAVREEVETMRAGLKHRGLPVPNTSILFNKALKMVDSEYQSTRPKPGSASAGNQTIARPSSRQDYSSLTGPERLEKWKRDNGFS